MSIDTQKQVGELAAGLPGAPQVFGKFGIDYCCGGKQTLESACGTAGVAVAEVVQSLEEAVQRPADQHRDWKTDTLRELIEHIVQRHHKYVRQELPRIDQLLQKVCGVHGSRHAELLEIRRAFAPLAQELTMHMMKEEQILFPYIVELENATLGQGGKPVPFFGTVQNPVRMMMMEHDSAGEALRNIRAATSNYALPPDACASYGELYRALVEFEADLHQHIHLENNILFPRAVEMEEHV